MRENTRFHAHLDWNQSTVITKNAYLELKQESINITKSNQRVSTGKARTYPAAAEVFRTVSTSKTSLKFINNQKIKAPGYRGLHPGGKELLAGELGLCPAWKVRQ